MTEFFNFFSEALYKWLTHLADPPLHTSNPHGPYFERDEMEIPEFGNACLLRRTVGLPIRASQGSASTSQTLTHRSHKYDVTHVSIFLSSPPFNRNRIHLNCTIKPCGPPSEWPLPNCDFTVRQCTHQMKPNALSKRLDKRLALELPC